jgi:tRNA/tmRNA/rRNA uracil-C5-methylase (TrmA/RlmC/RlmD family)
VSTLIPGAETSPSEFAVGAVLGPLEVGGVAHGGHCVARHEGRVVFVRHALPGERVLVRVTELAKRFARADVVSVVEASAERVVPPCPVAGRCGGCDLQHVEPAFQRELKRRVLAEQLRHLAGFDWDGAVEEVPPLAGSRTRMRYLVAPDGRVGLRAHRSAEVVALPESGCLVAAAAIARPGSAWRPGEELLAVAGERPFVRPRAAVAGATVVEEVLGHRFTVAADGFWQAHPAAPEVLTRAVLDGLRPEPGERAFDLFCGVGVFAAALVAAGCRVWGVEGDRRAVDLAAGNVPEARFVRGAVERGLARLPDRADLVVLDPPRTGAGRAVIDAVVARRPRAVAYVACDPAALARDLGFAQQAGYTVGSVRAFDLFPMTHHLEAVAILRR